MNDEAAERLIALLMEADVRWPDKDTRLSGSMLAIKFDAALAAERKATVERIRAALDPDDLDRNINRSRVFAILDAEAAREGVQ